MTCCPHIITSKEGTSHCSLAEASVKELNAQVETYKWMMDASKHIISANNELQRCNDKWKISYNDIQSENARLRSALERIRDIDYRGNAHQSRYIAQIALKDNPNPKAE